MEYKSNFSVLVRDPDDSYYNVSEEYQNWTFSAYDVNHDFMIRLIPEEVRGVPGKTARIRLMIWNKGSVANRFFPIISSDMPYETDIPLEDGLQVAPGRAVNVTMDFDVPYTMGSRSVDVDVTDLQGTVKSATAIVNVDPDSFLQSNMVFYALIGIIFLLFLFVLFRRR